MLTPLIFVVIAALIFDYTNGDRVRPRATACDRPRARR